MLKVRHQCMHVSESMVKTCYITTPSANMATSKRCNCLQNLPYVVQFLARKPCCCLQHCPFLCTLHHHSLSLATCYRDSPSLSACTAVVQAVQLVAETALGCAVNTPPSVLLC